MLIGSAIWAYIISAGCGVIATLNPQSVEFRQTMDELNYFARDKALPPQLVVKLRTFFQNTQHIIFARQYDGLLEKMSPLLRGEAALRVASKSISKVCVLSLEGPPRRVRCFLLSPLTFPLPPPSPPSPLPLPLCPSPSSPPSLPSLSTLCSHLLPAALFRTRRGRGLLPCQCRPLDARRHLLPPRVCPH